jgi:hypothetical protein
MPSLKLLQRRTSEPTLPYCSELVEELGGDACRWRQAGVVEGVGSGRNTFRPEIISYRSFLLFRLQMKLIRFHIPLMTREVISGGDLGGEAPVFTGLHVFYHKPGGEGLVLRGYGKGSCRISVLCGFSAPYILK